MHGGRQTACFLKRNASITLDWAGMMLGSKVWGESIESSFPRNLFPEGSDFDVESLIACITEFLAFDLDVLVCGK